MFDIGDWKSYLNQDVVEAMPIISGWDDAPRFYPIGLCDTPSLLEQEYERRGLIADPVGLLAYARKHPESFRSNPFMCQWRDKAGDLCYATFFYRVVNPELQKTPAVMVAKILDPSTLRWSQSYRFAGVPIMTPVV